MFFKVLGRELIWNFGSPTCMNLEKRFEIFGTYKLSEFFHAAGSVFVISNDFFHILKKELPWRCHVSVSTVVMTILEGHWIAQTL